jgi:hypothetical protein
LYGLLADQDEFPREEEQACADDAGYSWRNNPCSKDLRHSLPSPVDFIDANRGCRGTDQSPHDRVCRRDWHAISGGKRKKDGRAHNGAQHSKEKDRRGAVIVVRVDDFGTDGIGNSFADSYTPRELANRRNNHGLLECERSRRDRRGEGICDIVGA